MEDFQDQDILDIPDGFEYNFGEVDFHGQCDQEEPMDYDNLENEKVMVHNNILFSYWIIRTSQ